jgi:hypothetical protein
LILPSITQLPPSNHIKRVSATLHTPKNRKEKAKQFCMETKRGLDEEWRKKIPGLLLHIFIAKAFG